MEKLTGLRRLYQHGNFQSHDYRAKMNSWSFGELQRQIEYKAKWEGIPVVYVNAAGTSKRCSICGSKMEPEENRISKCPSCGLRIDRDVNAARNITVRGWVRFAHPEGRQSEAMVPERCPTINPESQLPEAVFAGNVPRSQQNRSRKTIITRPVLVL